MYLTLKQQVKHLSKKEFRNLKYLSHIAKNLTNEAIYNRLVRKLLKFNKTNILKQGVLTPCGNKKFRLSNRSNILFFIILFLLTLTNKIIFFLSA